MAVTNAPLAVALVAALAICGCNWSSSAQTGTNVAGPDRVVHDFLDAVRTGDDKRAAELLSPLARKRTSEMEIVVAPPGSETARFSVGTVELAEDQAQVYSQWTDLDSDGRLHTDDIVWMLRHQREGWRIVGMATKVFSDREAVLLNFEEPEEMLRKQQLAEEELARREQESEKTAPTPLPPHDGRRR